MLERRVLLTLSVCASLVTTRRAPLLEALRSHFMTRGSDVERAREAERKEESNAKSQKEAEIPAVRARVVIESSKKER